VAVSQLEAARLDSLATVDESLGASGPPVQELGTGSSSQRTTGTNAAEVTRCVNEPWLIEPEDARLHFLYLKTPGFRLDRRNLADCPTRNRIIVYPAANALERTIVCPAEGNATGRHNQGPEPPRIVELVSGGWNRTGSVVLQAADGSLHSPQSQQQQQHSRSFVVEFLQQEPGYYVVTWMAISKRLLSAPGDSFFGGVVGTSSPECPYR
jgi:hypothetical protein